jgi:galactose mutarotase-like enzyme
MPDAHHIGERKQQGYSVVELRSPAGLAADYVPEAGMVGSSLRWHGDELLGLRRGLVAYAREGSTMGIPLLHPWANRLARDGYAVAGRTVSFPAGSRLLHRDGNGLPIHGLLAGYPHWRVLDSRADADGARLVAILDVGALPDVMELFPFPHHLAIEVRLAGNTLTTTTVVEATGDEPVPIAFGYHPYLSLAGLPREDWQVELPVRRRMRLDERHLPTGEDEPVTWSAGRLGQRTFDDLFVELEPEPVFALQGAGRRLEVAFVEGYRCAVVYAPADDEVICFEPMTAPTNPFGDDAALAFAEPGRPYAATFRISATEPR